MSYDIKFLSLQKNELAYEVEVRGEVPANKLEDLRKQISKLCRIFPSEDILCSPFDPARDAAALEESLDKLEKNHKSLLVKYDKSLFGRSKALCNHIYHRMNRIDCSSHPESLDIINALLERFLTLQPFFKESDYTPSVGVVDAESVPANTPLVVSCTKNFGELATLKYDGKSCPRAFIQRVDEFVRARSIPASKVLAFATEIFTHEALHWFRAVQGQVSSWDELKVKLREDFGHADYDYRFMSEIRARTQGERENITIYLSVMAGMFSQLSKSLSEEEKLEILLHNIRPCYASVLTSATAIESIESLRVLCRNFEDVQSRLAQFQEPPRPSSSTLAPEFAYLQAGLPDSSKPKSFPNERSDNRFQANQFQASKPFHNNNNYRSQGNNNSRPVHSVQVRNKFCPRCRVDTHGLRNCTVERKIVCFRCGRPDVRFFDCPDCQKPFITERKN